MSESNSDLAEQSKILSSCSSSSLSSCGHHSKSDKTDVITLSKESTSSNLSHSCGSTNIDCKCEDRISTVFDFNEHRNQTEVNLLKSEKCDNVSIIAHSDLSTHSDLLSLYEHPCSEAQLNSHPEILNVDRLQQEYDENVEKTIEKATMSINRKNKSFGWYQFFSFLFISLSWTIGNGWYAYVGTFTGYAAKHECFENNSLNRGFMAKEDSCALINNATHEATKCTKWTYDKSQMESTIITEYDFVCDKNFYFETAYTIEQIGYIIGTLIFSVLADKIGRKPVLTGVLLSMSVLGFIQYWVKNFYAYMSIGFFINLSASGLDSVCVPLVLEIFTTSRRTAFGIGMEYVWVVMLTLLAPVAYFIRRWRELRIFIFGVLTLLGLSSFWMVQESVTWLISTHQFEKARSVLERIARFNFLSRSKKFKADKAELCHDFFKLRTLREQIKCLKYRNDSSHKTSDELSLKEMIKSISNNPKYRIYVLIMGLNWCATSLIYDGLTYMSNFVGENIFINWTLMTIVELPAQVLCHFLLARYGRRMTTSSSLIACGCALIINFLLTFIVNSESNIHLIMYMIAKFTMTQAYSAVILHAPEIFPTNLRSFGYGLCLFSGKLTSVISPLISLYLSKVFSWLPGVIYGVISIICGFICLYVPETLNRSLPNSIDDVLKWPRDLTAQEWEAVKETNDFNVQIRKCAKRLGVSQKRKFTPGIENVNLHDDNSV